MSLSFKVGNIVRVASRTWPGINKPGGVGKVTKINDDAKTINVKYVLGGTERNVEWKYVSANAFGDSCNFGIGDGTFSTTSDRDVSKTKLELNEPGDKIDSKRAKIEPGGTSGSFKVYSDTTSMVAKNVQKDQESKLTNQKSKKKIEVKSKIKFDAQESVPARSKKKISEKNRTALQSSNVQKEKVAAGEKPLKKISKRAKEKNTSKGREGQGNNLKNEGKERELSTCMHIALKSGKPSNEDVIITQDDSCQKNRDDPSESVFSKPKNMIDEARLDQFMPILREAMRSDSATISAIIEVSNTSTANSDLKFTDIEIRSFVRLLNENNTVFFHDQEDTVYSI